MTITTTKLKTAFVTKATIELTCPECGEGVEAPSGSFMITPEDYTLMTLNGNKAICKHCQELFRLPARPFQTK